MLILNKLYFLSFVKFYFTLIIDLCIKINTMNWIILIIAGLFEVAFAFCLGKAKESTGTEMYLWYGGFLVTLCISMGLLITKRHKLCLLEQLMLFGRGLVQWVQY